MIKHHTNGTRVNVADFRDYEDYEENRYITHPRSPRTRGASGRVLEAASGWLHVTDQYDEQTSLLIGTIGESGAGDRMAFAKLAAGTTIH